MLNPLEIISQTADFVVVNKPAGLSFHSETGPGLVVLAEQQLGTKLYPVHRLDKLTSGLLILARSTRAAAALTELFTTRQIAKFYLALSMQKPLKKQGWVKGDMQPARRGAWRLTTTQSQPAVTYFVSHGYQEWPFRAFLLRPFTGKTHQLRVALKSQAAAILGDTLYGGGAADRMYLHAFALAFTYKGESYQFTLLPDSGAQFAALLAAKLPETWYTPWDVSWPAAPKLSETITTARDE